jgi:ABC-2 type transport system ATP-binding protein
MGTHSGQPAVRAEGLVKTFGSTHALDGVDLEIPAGKVLGLLGPNGAGKTTTVRILTTLLRPDSGRAWVAGHDVLADPEAVRREIGLSGQYAAVDENLTGFENLYMVGRFYGFSKADARTRSRELLGDFHLREAADRTAKTYSGGMRRRLDLAASLVGRPDVIFLDEPTTGLDPESRIGMWEIVETLVGDGTTVLLTTQYLDEADRLADSITVLAQGKVVASGTATELKAQVGKRTVVVTLSEPGDGESAVAALERVGLQPVLDGERHAVITPVDRSAELAVVVRALDQDSIEVAELALTEPTLDDVYLTLAHSSAAA